MQRFVATTSSLIVAGALGFVVAGCGSKHAVSLGPPPRSTATTGPEVTEIGTTSTTGVGTLPTPRRFAFEVWFARGDQLVAASRTHRATPRVATAAVQALLAGPTPAERGSGIATAIPAGTRLIGISIKGGVATVDLTSQYQSGGGSLSMQLRLAQVVYTVTQFPTVRAVRFQLDGSPVNVFSSQGIVLDHPVGRGDYKGLASAVTPIAGTWRPLPPAPIAPDEGLSSVWTGKQLLLFGRKTRHAKDGAILGRVNVAAAYDPVTNAWRRLSPPGATSSFLGYSTAWTGKEMLVWGQGTRLAFDPLGNRWRRLAGSSLLAVHDGHGLVVWTGRELIGWGGGCCGDAFSDGVAYNPATDAWRALPQSPLAGSQHPIGAWTGRELIIFVGGFDPEGKPWPERLARAAAYDPATNTWRRIAPLPAPRDGASAVWDGREILVVGGTGGTRVGKPAPPTTVGLAYDPVTNRWRRLPAMESGRIGAAVVWTGRRLLLWGGSETGGGSSPVSPPHGLAFDPLADRWASLPQAPLQGRLGPTAVWTGRSLVVWGGATSVCGKNSCRTKAFADGAVFTPANP